MPWKEKRARVERGLYKVGDVYWACATPTGARKPQWRRLGQVGVQEARRKRDEFAYRVKTGQAAPSSRRLTVRELADEWLQYLEQLVQAGELRPRTLESYRTGVRLHWLPALGSRRVESITAEDLVSWHEAQRRAGAAHWSIRARWVAFRGLLGYGVRTGVIAANPADALLRRERPKLGRPRDRFLTTPEIEALLHHAKGSASLTVPLLVFSGLRVSELLGLTWQDVDFERQVLSVRYQMTRKGNRRVALKTDSGYREVIVMAALGRRLREARLAARFSRDEDLVICNGVGRTLGYSRLRKAFAATCNVAGVEGATPHTCRHTFASLLIAQGREVAFVAQQLGHASTKTTWDTYVHLFRARDNAEAARNALDADFGRMLRAADRPQPL
jgi:integrase